MNLYCVLKKAVMRIVNLPLNILAVANHAHHAQHTSESLSCDVHWVEKTYVLVLLFFMDVCQSCWQIGLIKKWRNLEGKIVRFTISQHLFTGSFVHVDAVKHELQLMQDGCPHNHVQKIE